MDPDVIPIGVWEQISVVVVFALLLSGVGYVLVKMFTKAIADINGHYARLFADQNVSWQMYFDARSESTAMMTVKLTERMDDIANLLRGLIEDHEKHDNRIQNAITKMDERSRK
jgi:rubrerythrin